MQQVHTSYGPGEIIATETVRGRVSYKVAVHNTDTEVWLSAEKLGFADPDDSFGHAKLPYNETPQYAVGPLSESTQQPIHHIDADDRLHDSVDGEDTSEYPEPGPAAHLFAAGYSIKMPNHNGMEAYPEDAYPPGHEFHDEDAGLHGHGEEQGYHPSDSYGDLSRPYPEDTDFGGGAPPQHQFADPEHFPFNPADHFAPDSGEDESAYADPFAGAQDGFGTGAASTGPYVHGSRYADVLESAPVRGFDDDFVVNDTDDEYLRDQDVTKDERDTVGPDGMYNDSPEAIQHFTTSYRQAAMLAPLAEGLIGGGEAGAAAGAGEAGGGLGNMSRMSLPGNPFSGGDDPQDPRNQFDKDKPLPLPDLGYGWGDLAGRMGSYERPAGLSDRYADIQFSAADYHNDPVLQFRHDPEAFINRQGHLHSEGLNPRFAQYGELVESDEMLRTAAWKDVRAKAVRLRREGAITVKDIDTDRIYASVVGDHGTYDTMIKKGGAFGGFGGGHSITNWHCSCEWGKWAFQRRLTYVGRLCSHGYACYMEMQSNHTKGKPRQKRQTPGPRQRRASDETTQDWKVRGTGEAKSELNKLRDWAEEPHETWNGNQAEHVDDVQEAVEKAREEGVDASQLVASLRPLELLTAATEHQATGLSDWLSGTLGIGGTPSAEDQIPRDGSGKKITPSAPVPSGPSAPSGSHEPGYSTSAPGPSVAPTVGFGPGEVRPGATPPSAAPKPGGATTPGVGQQSSPGNTMNGTPSASGGGASSPTAPGKTPGVGQPSSPLNTTDGAPSPGTPGAATGGDYTVKPGDTLNGIAKGQGISDFNDIAKANSGAMSSGTDLSKNVNMIHPGDVLKMPGSGGGDSKPGGDVSGIGAGGTPMKPSALGTPAASPATPSAPDAAASSNSNGPAAATPPAATPPPAALPATPSPAASSNSAASPQIKSMRQRFAAPPGPPVGLDDPALADPKLNNPPAPTGTPASGTGAGPAPGPAANPAPAAPGGVTPSSLGTPAAGGGGNGAASAEAWAAANGLTKNTDGPGWTGTGKPDANAAGIKGQEETGDSIPSKSTLPGGANNGSGLGSSGSGGGFDMSSIGDTIGQVGDAISSGVGIAKDIGSAIGGIFGSVQERQDYLDWRTAAYPDDPIGDMLPHEPFTGSGNPGPLDIHDSESNVRDNYKGDREDVTDLGKDDITQFTDAERHQAMTQGIRRAGKGPQRRAVQPVVVRERRPRQAMAVEAEHIPDFADDDPYSKTAADFSSDSGASHQQMVAAFHASGGGAVNSASSAVSQYDDFSSSPAFQRTMQRTAGRNYSLAEQDALIREGDKGGAGNLGSLDLKGTHYEAMNSVGLW